MLAVVLIITHHSSLFYLTHFYLTIASFRPQFAVNLLSICFQVALTSHLSVIHSQSRKYLPGLGRPARPARCCADAFEMEYATSFPAVLNDGTLVPALIWQKPGHKFPEHLHAFPCWLSARLIRVE